MDKNRFKGLYSFVKASEIWGLKDSTLRKARKAGRLIEDVDCKKFGRDWVVTEEAMIREYGKPDCDRFLDHPECEYCKLRGGCEDIAKTHKPNPKDFEDDGIII